MITPNTPLPAERLEEIRQELAAATPGIRLPREDEYSLSIKRETLVLDNPTWLVVAATLNPYMGNLSANMQFFAHTQTAIAELLGEVERLKADARLGQVVREMPRFAGIVRTGHSAYLGTAKGGTMNVDELMAWQEKVNAAIREAGEV